jgi:hypothetical protein
MARPVKNFCDYFPHDNGMRNHKKVRAIRSKFGLAGYAMWVMLLEHLTGSDGNVFEYSDMEFELMGGDFGVSVTEIREVVDYCIKLELLFCIDGFVSSESLDERLLSVYEKRKLAKQVSAKQSRINGRFSNNNTVPSEVSVTEMPQSKVNEKKVKEIKEVNTPPPIEEFLGYCKTLMNGKYESYKFSIQGKYEAWVENKWKDGNNQVIKNWKLKIKNTLPYLKPMTVDDIIEPKNTAVFATEEEKRLAMEAWANED